MMSQAYRITAVKRLTQLKVMQQFPVYERRIFTVGAV